MHLYSLIFKPRGFLKSFFHLFMILGVFSNVNGQDKVKPFKYAISLNQSLSHTGINSGITANIRYKNHEIYGGPEMALSDSYFEEDPRMGFTSGVRFYSSNHDKKSSFVFLNYQRIYCRPFLQDKFNSKKFNTTSEITLGLGQEWRLGKKFYLGISMGYGKYYDVYHDLIEGNIAYFDDFSALLRISGTYKL